MADKKDPADLWQELKKRMNNMNNNKSPKRRAGLTLGYLIIVLGGLALVNLVMNQPQDTEIPYSQFKRMVSQGEFQSVRLAADYYYGFPGAAGSSESASAQGTTGGLFSALSPTGPVYRTVPVEDPQLVPLLDKQGITYRAVPERTNYFLVFVLNWLVPIVFFIILWRFLFKRVSNMNSGMMTFGKNKSRIVAENSTKTNFGDVAGADEAKEELVEVVDFLKRPQRYQDIGGKIPKGVLLVGPPGTGKTLLARAVAGEAGVTFFRMSGADFVEMFVGVGASRVRDLFKQAREKAPCIIFIDELDAVGKSRAAGMSTNDEREQTLNQLLVEMDGFDSTSGVILLAATNRPEVLDPALLRPGRFDRQVMVDRPDLKGREAILRIHSQGVKLAPSVDLGEVARGTPGMVGSDLANVVNEAALLAVRGGRKEVLQEDFSEAVEKAVAGLEKKSRLINKKERRIVAYHETGHALAAAYTEGADPVQKISIVPRGMGALGYTLQLPAEDRFLMTQEELIGRIDVLLGGRAAEKLIFGQISTGAANDLTRATDIARSMITQYGMSERFENVTLEDRSQAAYLGPGMKSREYSENTQQYVDEEIARILAARYQKVLSLLEEKRESLEKVAAALLEKEILTRKEFGDLTGLPLGEADADKDVEGSEGQGD